MKYIFISIILALFSINGYAGGDQAISSAYHDRISDIQVGSSGIVIKTLPDDNAGSRHQRFILRLSTGQTLLISHNIDLTPKLDSLRIGDPIVMLKTKFIK